MTVLTETAGPASCLISEGDHFYSRDEVTVVAGAGVTLAANTVLGKVTADGTYKLYNPSNTDGSQTVAAVLISPVTGTARRAVLRRLAQVKSDHLVWFSGATTNQKTTGITGLASLGIIAR